MKTKEFIKRVEELGYYVMDGVKNYYIRSFDGELIASINKLITFQIRTEYDGWDEISSEIKKGLFDIISKYASTPPDEREEEKKFYLRHRWFKPHSIYKNYLNHWIGHDDYWLDYKNESKEIKTKFTLKEIDEIKEKFNTDLKDFKRSEVKE